MSDSKKKLDDAYDGVMKSFDKIEDKGRKIESSLVLLSGLVLGCFIASLLMAVDNYIV
jgi:hypothetical protein